MLSKDTLEQVYDTYDTALKVGNMLTVMRRANSDSDAACVALAADKVIERAAEVLDRAQKLKAAVLKDLSAPR